jgi:hypothetical protein
MVRGIAIALLLLESVAWAEDPLAQARTAVSESDYPSARPALAAALQAGGRAPDELAEIYRLTGIVEAALGNAAAATDAFTRLLAVSPKAVLPEGTSPKIRRPFEAAATYFTSHQPLEIVLETSERPPALTLVVISDPLHMAAVARATYTVDGGPERVSDVAVAERTIIALPFGRVSARIAALDARGNRVVELGASEPIVVVTAKPAPRVVAAPGAAPVIVHAERSLYQRWWPYAAGGAVAAGLTTYFGLSARSDRDELARIVANSSQHHFSDERAAEDRTRRAVLLTNIGLGVTGALAITAGALYLLTPRDRVETRLAAVPVPGGGALVLGGHY